LRPPVPASERKATPLTALFVERDKRYIRAIRRVRFGVEPGEYADPRRRPALIARIITQATDALRSEDETVIAPAPVILVINELTGQFTQYDYPTKPLLLLPGQRILKTTYARYAEVLPHLEMTPEVKTELDRRTLYIVANANSALRARLMDVINTPAALAAQPRKIGGTGLIDLRLRLIVQRPDLRVLVSLQAPETGSKIITSAGIVE
jgi:hypothetical protein